MHLNNTVYTSQYRICRGGCGGKRFSLLLLSGSLCIVHHTERSSLKEHDTAGVWVDEVNYFVADGAFGFSRWHGLLLADR